MKWLPESDAKVSTLKLPGDIKARMKQPHVIELAESIRKRTGGRPIHLPTFEYPSKELIAGRDRIAAALLNGEKVVRVQFVSQLTAKERRDLERDENIHRRVDNRDELVKQRVAEREAEIAAERAESDEPTERKPGRPKTARGEAREQVARELGTTYDAVRVAEARAEADEEDPHEEQVACPVETYGLALVTADEAVEIRSVQDALDQADGLLRRAQGLLRPIAGGAFTSTSSGLTVENVLDRLHAVASDLRQTRPTAVCPSCKRAVAKCFACKGSGFVGPGGMQFVADELKLGGAQAMVSAGGKLVPYAVYRRDTGRAEAAKRVRIEDESGRSLTDEDVPF